jgi:hypothetical protein
MTAQRLRVVQGGAKRPGPVDAKRWIVAVMADQQLPPYARVVAGYIGALFNPTKGYAHPAVPRIAKDTGFTERSVFRAIKMIADQGHFLVNSGGGRTKANAYHLNFETRTPGTGFKAPKTLPPQSGFPDENPDQRRKKPCPNGPLNPDSTVTPTRRTQQEDTTSGAASGEPQASPPRPAPPKKRARSRSQGASHPEAGARGARADGARRAPPDGDPAPTPESILGPKLWHELCQWFSIDHATVIFEHGLKAKRGPVPYANAAIRKAQASADAENRAHADPITPALKLQREREARQQEARAQIDALDLAVLGDNGRDLVNQLLQLIDPEAALSNLRWHLEPLNNAQRKAGVPEAPRERLISSIKYFRREKRKDLTP